MVVVVRLGKGEELELLDWKVLLLCTGCLLGTTFFILTLTHSFLSFELDCILLPLIIHTPWHLLTWNFSNPSQKIQARSPRMIPPIAIPLIVIPSTMIYLTIRSPKIMSPTKMSATMMPTMMAPTVIALAVTVRLARL